MTKNWVVFGLFSLSLYSGALAYPLNPLPRTIDNGGDTLTYQRVGDEHYQFARTMDGFLILPDEKGIYYFADEQGNRTEIKAKNEKFRTSRESKFLEKLDKKKSFRQHRESNPDKHVHPKHEGKIQKAPWVPSGNTSDSGLPPILRMPSPAGHSSGTNRFPVILVTPSGATSSLDSANFHDMLNAENYTRNGFTGSVKDYFTDQSFGKFVPSFDVYKISLGTTLSSYAGNDHKLVVDAVSALNNIPGFDASVYDADNNGDVDMVAVLYVGSDESGIGGYQYRLEWNGVWNLKVGGKRFNSYFLISQGTNPFPTFIHEFSHTMGLMDHYCVEYEGGDKCEASNGYPFPGAHAWDVMATGMYNNNGMTPVGYSAFERNFMGWMEYIPLSASSEATTIAPLNTHNTAYKIAVKGDEDEWFVLENRQKTKWDAAIPNHGLLIWHIDFDQTKWDGNGMNNSASHQNVDVVEAGNIIVPDYYSGFDANYLKDDPFPGSQNKTDYGPFTSWAGISQGIQLYRITEKNGNICFATQDGIEVGDCLLVSSSSEAISSSSAEAFSSSSAEVSSSSADPISSSSAEITLGIQGKSLHVLANTKGTKQVSLFDLQGNLLEQYSFEGSLTEIDLSRSGQGLRIVRVMENGKIKAIHRITLK